MTIYIFGWISIRGNARNSDQPQASLPFRTGAMVLCILYGLGLNGAWTLGADELEVYEARLEGTRKICRKMMMSELIPVV